MKQAILRQPTAEASYQCFAFLRTPPIERCSSAYICMLIINLMLIDRNHVAICTGLSCNVTWRFSTLMVYIDRWCRVVLPTGAGYSSPSSYGGQDNMAQYAGQQYLNDPMANMAMQYGQNLAGQGKDYLHKNVRSFPSSTLYGLQYYTCLPQNFGHHRLTRYFSPREKCPSYSF